jgi:hypothetical protein
MREFSDIVEKVTAARAAFDAAVDTEKVQAAIRGVIEAERAKYTTEGVFTGSEVGVQQLERTLQAKANVAALTTATEFEIAHDAARKTLAQVRASYETVKMPAQQYQGPDVAIKAALRMADATETHVAFLSMQGRTLADLAEAYARATDGGETVFVALVEQGVQDAWRAWPVTRTDSDAAAVMRMRDAVAKRKAGRVPLALVEAETEVNAALPATVDATIRLLRGGHLRIAARQSV